MALIKTCFGQFVVSRYTASHSGSLAFTFTLTRLFYSFSFFLLSMIDRLRLATYISISDKVRALKPFTNCISLYFFRLLHETVLGVLQAFPQSTLHIGVRLEDSYPVVVKQRHVVMLRKNS